MGAAGRDELDVVRAVANAKLCVGDGLKTLRLVSGGIRWIGQVRIEPRG